MTLRKKDYPNYWQGQFEQQQKKIKELEDILKTPLEFVQKLRDAKDKVIFWFRLTVGLIGCAMVFGGFFYQQIAQVLNNYTPLSLGYQEGRGAGQIIIITIGGFMVLGVMLSRWRYDD